MSKWTDEQVAFLIVRKSEGDKMPEICKKMNRKFKMNRTTPQLYSKFHKLKEQYKNNLNTIKVEKSPSSKKDKPVGRYLKYTQKRIDYIHATYENNFPRQVVIDGFKEQFGVDITNSQILYIMKNKIPTSSILVEEKIVEERIDKDAKAIDWWVLNKGVWSKPIEVEETTEVIISEVVEETTPEEVKRNRTRHHWTKEEELKLLCDFYELSIDEAREHFQRPYYAIAKRLEMIVDSTEPKHIEMLIAASKVIKERKEMMYQSANSTRRSRRKLRKQAKKVAKLEKKLKKMRGE